MKKKKLKAYFVLGLFFGFIAMASILVIGRTSSICANSLSCIKDLSGNFEEGQNEGIFLGKKVAVPKILTKGFLPQPVLGADTGEKRIEINLGNQHLYAYQADQIIYDFPVSTGKWYPTPTGTFEIWIKLRATRMSGGNPAWGTYYNLPNVQYTMYFYNNEVSKARGFGIHGAYWHNNFGHPMSHGCVNMKTEDAAVLYAWADPPTTGYTTYTEKDNPGTKVIIYGVTPKE